MADLRKLTSKLNLEISDKIAGDLGYRQFTLFIPQFGFMNPRPKVIDVTSRFVPESLMVSWIDILGKVPNKLYDIYIAKWFNDSELTENLLNSDKRLWTLTDESGNTVTVRPLNFKDKNSRIIVTVAVVKTGSI